MRKTFVGFATQVKTRAGLRICPSAQPKEPTKITQCSSTTTVPQMQVSYPEENTTTFVLPVFLSFTSVFQNGDQCLQLAFWWCKNLCIICVQQATYLTYHILKIFVSKLQWDFKNEIFHQKETSNFISRTIQIENKF